MSHSQTGGPLVSFCFVVIAPGEISSEKRPVSFRLFGTGEIHLGQEPVSSPIGRIFTEHSRKAA